jgi:hypothetical protein
MEPMKERELQTICQLQALELLVVMTIRQLHTALPPGSMPIDRLPQNPWEGQSVPGHPEASDMFVSELQEAWNKLRTQVLAPAT